MLANEYQFSKTTFHPWIGKDYENAPHGLRLLVLGESHYWGDDAPDRGADTTRYAIETWRSKSFWKHLDKLIPGHLEGAAFYNYVQHIVGKVARKRPEHWMWTSPESIKGLKEALSVLKPHRVLVLGKANWESMAGSSQFPDAPPLREDKFRLPETFCRYLDPETDCHAYWYPTSRGMYALCAPIYHPGYPKGFHSPDTQVVLKSLLDKSWARRNAGHTNP